jgi:hypothetical protein
METDMWTEQTIADVGWGLRVAISKGDCSKIQLVVSENPWVVTDNDWAGSSWMAAAVTKGRLDVVQLMFDLGFGIKHLEDGKFSLLSKAIHKEHDDIVTFLLAQGADPNVDRPLIAAMNVRNPERRMRYVKLLLEHGVNVNNLFEMYGDPNNLMTALDWAKSFPEIADYLKAHGAKSAAEIRATSGSSNDKNVEVDPAIAAAEEVIAHFNEHVGPAEQRQIIEIVPSGHPVAIHWIKPHGDRKHLTLFTTGLSTQPMHTPAGEESWAFAELFMELPGDWPVDKSSQSQWGWPADWLRQVAQYPHNHKTWLGGPLTIFANDDPPRPLAPSNTFTSLLLLAEFSFERSDGKTVHLYRVTPLYPDERELEMREGAPALLRAFDRRQVPFVVDVNRRSVVSDD